MGRTGRHRSRKRCEHRAVTCAHDDDTVTLRRWMKQTADFSSDLVPTVFYDTGRGLMTKKKLQPGDTLVTVPFRLLITTKTVLESDIGGIIKRWQPKLTPLQCIAVFLIWEKHRQSTSPWQSFINVLPSSFTTPVYFTKTELSFLPKSVRLKAKQQRHQLETTYSNIKEFCKSNWNELYDVITFDIYCWAWSAINTRGVFYKSPPSEFLSTEEEDHIAMAPFLDLLNHSPTANIKAGFNAVTNCYEIQTYDTYQPYGQVFISYGAHSNHKLFLEYGFCVPHNDQDELEFNYDDVIEACKVMKLDNLPQKCTILRDHDLLGCLCCSMDGLSWKLWTSLKTFAMTWDQMQNWSLLYADETFQDTVPMATKLAKYLINQYLTDNIDQENIILNKNPTPSPHVDIARTLLHIEKQMLTVSLNKLPA